MTMLYMGRTVEEIVAALEIWDRHRTPKHELLGKLKTLRDDSPETQTRFFNDIMVGIAEMVLDEEKLRREKEDLRMFCTGVARNITEMLK